MKKKINIEDVLLPEHGELQIDEDSNAYSAILDAELDEVQLEFHNDWCVHVNTEELTYITLTVENLETMIGLIGEAQDYYDSDEWKERCKED